MFTMLYDAETLKPQLLIEQEIKSGDIGKCFWVINGDWYGTFNGDSISIHHPDYEDRIPSTVYKCYRFTSPPPDEYFKIYSTYHPNDRIGIPYQPWFVHFEDLIDKGEVNIHSY